MAPTTLIGQRATTAPGGRTKEQAGMPMRVAEMLSTMDGVVYAERVCVTDIPHLNKAKKALKKAFERQMRGEGFTIVIPPQASALRREAWHRRRRPGRRTPGFAPGRGSGRSHRRCRWDRCRRPG